MRSMWKGSLSFGLVSIPVEMYVASRDREFKFVLLHDADHSQIRYARICKDEEKEVPWNHVVKGYESEKGEFIVMADEDFQKASKERTEFIEINEFANENEIDSIFFEKPYYLEPQRGATKAYALLVATLKKSGKVGIATYVIHNRAHVGVVKVYGNMLVLNQLRFASEIVAAKELKLPKVAQVSAKELTMAMQLIDSMTTKFKPEKYKDTYTQELKKIIQNKARGKKVIKKPTKVREAKVIDLMSALKASLTEKRKKSA